MAKGEVMATVRKLTIKEPDRISRQSDTQATIALIEFGGEKYIQLDSVGSEGRQLIGKRSQSMRLSKTAFDQLVDFGRKHFGDER
jgi:hypothetical protein